MGLKFSSQAKEGKSLGIKNFLTEDRIFRGLRNISIIICSSTWSFEAWSQLGYSHKLHKISSRLCLVPLKGLDG
jgi:hypothetical protein